MKKCSSYGKFKQEDQFHWRNELLRKRRGYSISCQAFKHRQWCENENNAKKVKEDTWPDESGHIWHSPSRHQTLGHMTLALRRLWCNRFFEMDKRGRLDD